MSLRARLVLIVFVSGVALAAALAAIVGLRASSDTARLEAAEATGQGVVEGLAAALAEEGVSLAEAPKRKTLVRAATDALAGTPRAVGGYCTKEGIVVQLRARQYRDARSAHLPEPQRLAVEAACAKGTAGAHRTDAAIETLVVVLAPVPGGNAFVFYAVRGVRQVPLVLQVEVVVLAAATLLLVLFVVDALVALRKGAAQLDAGLTALSTDLRAPIPEPRAAELAAIAHGLLRMARSLEEAQAQKKALADSLAHEQRLAGLGRLAAGMAHEIRNPLAGMKLRLDLMADDPALGDEARVDVKACLAEVARLDRLVHSLLGVARKGNAPAEDLALHALVDERIALVGSESIRVSRTGEARCTTDRDALCRVLDNLIRNAVEASPPGSEVQVAVARDPSGVHLRVVDQGPGIAEARAAELFEPFFTTKPAGTGLGLWMSRSLVETLGGALRYLREDGRTVFVVDLPGAA